MRPKSLRLLLQSPPAERPYREPEAPPINPELKEMVVLVWSPWGGLHSNRDHPKPKKETFTWHSAAESSGPQD